MKNEHKIDYVSMHEDRDLGLQSFGNIKGALERGSRPARAGSQQFASFGCFDIFSAFGIFFPTTLNFIWDPKTVYFSLQSLSRFFFCFPKFLSHFLVCSWWVLIFKGNFCSLWLLKSSKLNHKKCPDHSRLRSLRFRICRSGFLLKNRSILQFHPSLNSLGIPILEVGVFQSFYYIKIIVVVFKNIISYLFDLFCC